MRMTKGNTWRTVARGTKVVALMLAAGAAAAIASAQPADDAPAARQDHDAGVDLWLRTKQTADRKLRMEVASRLYEREGSPPIMLVGAVHIADPDYYDALEAMLVENDMVLFEGVSPAGVERVIPADPTERVALTESRLRLLATLLHQARAAGGEARSIDELAKQLDGKYRALGWLHAARTDAWGHAIEVIDADGDRFDVRSPGPNGRFEATRSDSDDLYFSSQAALSPEEKGEVAGIQAKLAKALGLVFQLDEMDLDHPNWRNVDMTAGQLEKRFEAAGLAGEGDGLFAMLEGTGLPAKMLGLVLGVIERLPGAQPRAKMMLMDMLTHADDLLEVGGVPGMEELMRVLIEDRNKVVIDELVRVLDEPETPQTIGVIYGAGHMPDLEERLRTLGYERAKERWVPAITLDLDRAGISRMERAIMKRQLEMQLDMMRRQAEAQQRQGAI